MDFVSIRTATLRGDQKIHFDVFVLVNGKYIAYLRQGDSLEGTRLDRLKAKKLKKMYIRPEQEQLYREYLTQNIEKAYDRGSGKSLESRAEVIQGAQQANTEAVMERPEDKAVYEMAKEGATRYVQFLLTEEKAVQSMLNIGNTDGDLAHHGVAVSTLSVAIANKIGLTDQSKVQMLALGALLHDFGHTKFPSRILAPSSQLSAEDMKTYAAHAAEGGEIVRHHRHFDEAVISIIMQHEELINGSGYPGKLIEAKTNPLAVIVSTANDFDRMMTFEKLPRADAVKKFTLNRLGLHPLEHVQALKGLV
jgi:putative nucleotidyltransferase with HDIG domain